MEDSSEDLMMMEERDDELMVPFPATEEEVPTLRTAHFVKPTLASQETPFTGFPPLRSNPESVNRASDVMYHGWRGTQKHWEDWVNRLKPLYGDTWKKVGIFDAILASTRLTKFHKEFMVELARKWCIETNTFMFSWGEATITLEDIIVLGGFPVLGQPVISIVETEEMLALDEELRKAHRDISRETGQFARESTWLKWFKGGGDKKLEHEAFLALWLSRYVFPGSYDIIARDLFLIAINLSKGEPIALGPAILASIYQDLGLFKEFLVGSSNSERGRFDCNSTKLGLCSPLGLVLVWAWERFPLLSPRPDPIELEQPRLARWHANQLEKVADDSVKSLDLAGEFFQWRPYAPKLTNWNPNKLYKDTEQYIIVGPNMDSEVETLVRCWRTSELLGIDCMEQYLPHRVGMQFGFDQDIPGFVERLNGHTAEFSWNHYNRHIRDAKLYIPARLFESDVTESYLKQWRAHQLNLRNENGAGNDALHTNAMQQVCDDNMSFPPQKDDGKIAENDGDYTISSPLQKVDDEIAENQPGLENAGDDDTISLPLQNDDGKTAENLSGGEILIDVPSRVDNLLFTIQKDYLKVEKRSSLLPSVKNDVPNPVDNILFPHQKDDPEIEKLLGAEILSSSSVINGETNLVTSNDDENFEDVLGKERLVNTVVEEEVDKSNRNGGDQQFSGEDGEKLPDRLIMLRKKMEKRSIRLGNLEKIVGQLKKQVLQMQHS